VIRSQVTNGVAVRMAALEVLAAPLAARRGR
jgi:aspartate carbamoyltransferase catalytic subunit